MKCPVCMTTELARTEYEGTSVKICPACHGFLLATNSLKRIERNMEMNADLLSEEAAERQDSPGELKCPRCFIAMKKASAPYGLDFTIDTCGSCGILWLDGGEIEALQSAFEQTPAALEMLRGKQAFKEMDKSRLETLNRNIAKARVRIPDRGKYMLSKHRHGMYGVVSNLIDSFFGI